MNLEKANIIISAALEAGKKAKLNPLTVAVLDVGGNLIAFQKQDGSLLSREQIAKGKATASLGMGIDSGKLLEQANGRPAFFQSAYAASNGKLIPVPGGVLVREKGKIIGAVGISGDKSEFDEACAIEGIRKAGLECEAITENRESALKSKL